jgi:hypothetical protein
MHLEKLNPTAPARALMGFGVSQSSAACGPEYSISAAVVQKLQRAYRVSEYHAATIARLASLGPQEGR